jgi:vacuolar-type H+-ATPase subunit I/STV1
MGQRFDLPSYGGITEKLQEVKKSIAESRTLTGTSRKQLKNYLMQINQISGGDDPSEQISALQVYKWFVAKEKTLYRQLNYFKGTNAYYLGYFWAPNEDEAKVREVLQAYPTTDLKIFGNHTITPPTYIKSNDFTFPF